MHFICMKPVLVQALSAFLLLAACGSGQSDSDGATAPAASAPATASTVPGTANPPAGAAHAYAYVAVDFSSNVIGFSIDSATGELTELGTVEARSLPVSILAHPAGRFIYVTNTWERGLSAFRVDPVTGALTFLGATDPEGAWPPQVAVERSGRFLYLTKNYGHDSVPFPPPQVPQEITTYRIDTETGGLTLAGTLVTGKYMAAIVAPAGADLVYVSSFPIGTSVSTLAAYAVDPASGALTLVAEIERVGRFDVQPDGSHAYLTRGSDPPGSAGTISVFRLDAGAGTLTQVGTSLPTGVGPSSIAVHPGGTFVYVANSDSHDIWSYRFDATTGTLVPSGPAFVGDGQFGGSFGEDGLPMTFDPSGRFVYVSGEDGVFVFRIDPATGGLTPVGAPQPVARRALAIATLNAGQP